MNKAWFISILFLLVSGCSSIGVNTKENVHHKINAVSFGVPAHDQIVIIYNHGVSRPQEAESCGMFYNKPPDSLKRLASKQVLIYSLCSTAVESPAPSSAGKQVYLRKREINYAIDALLSRGVKPKHIFLAGHSNGAWTSLMMMRDVNKRFNGAIAFAPAFAGKRKEVSIAPWWRKTVRPRQIKDMLGSAEMDALIFAYLDDEYNRPQDLQFLPERYPKTVELVSYGCNYKPAHFTYRYDCRMVKTRKKIKTFIKDQIANWNNK